MSRRESRIEALMILYQNDIKKEKSPVKDGATWTSLEGKPLHPFSLALIEAVNLHLEEIDVRIRKFSQHWRLERLHYIERNLLRLGACELLYFKDIPAEVTINEIIELAKIYGEEGSPELINGILDAIYKDEINPKATPP